MVLPYAAYLRIYEPLSAFPAALEKRWAAYAASPDRPRRAGALAAEHAEALRRVIALPPVPVPEWESGEAYVRWADGVTYICPWQTRLRSWLALARLRSVMPAVARAAFPDGSADAAAADFGRLEPEGPSLRVYIQTSAWTVPFAWFIPFTADERWLVLGTAGSQGDGGQATAAGTRALVYATTMAQARHRVARALSVISQVPPMPTESPAATPVPAAAGLAELGHWLAESHPHALVELDYGGLVHLLDDGALCADQSVAEVCAAVSALAADEAEFAAAMCQRFVRRWRALAVLERAS